MTSQRSQVAKTRALSQKTEFVYIDRAGNGVAVLIPGWATDYRIFNFLDLEFNYLVPLYFSPFDFIQVLQEALRKYGLKKVVLFGYSLGGFVASEFAYKYSDFVDGLILTSIRKKYDRNELIKVREQLKRKKRSYLYKFYKDCLGSRSDIKDFGNGLFWDYIERLSLDYLLGTLDYLATSEIRPELLKPVKKIKIIHGSKDRIAPIREAMEIGETLSQAEFIVIENEGHIPFLNDSFREVVKWDE